MGLRARRVMKFVQHVGEGSLWMMALNYSISELVHRSALLGSLFLSTATPLPLPTTGRRNISVYHHSDQM
jgi:hypothetical protein